MHNFVHLTLWKVNAGSGQKTNCRHSSVRTLCFLFPCLEKDEASICAEIWLLCMGAIGAGDDVRPYCYVSNEKQCGCV